MNKKIFTATIVIIAILIVGYYILYKAAPSDQLSISQSNPTSTSITTATRAPFDRNSFFQGEVKFHAFVNTSTKDVVSFQLHGGKENQTINSVFDTLVNGKVAQAIEPVGTPSELVGGMAISMGTFSPDNKYLAFRSRAAMSAASYDLEIYIVNIPAAKVFELSLPVRKEAIKISDNKYQEIDNFVDSYSWGNNNDIAVIMYAVGHDVAGSYRITPKETWSYDLKTGSSTLISSIP